MAKQVRNPWRVAIGRKTGTQQNDYGSESAAYAAIRQILSADTRDLIRIDVEWHDWKIGRWLPYETLTPEGTSR